jgi:hypothetical protein
MEEKQFMATLNTRIIIRNDATGEWKKVENDIVLLKGEMGIEFPDEGTPKIKIGDGTTTWANLGYATMTPDEIDSLIISSITSKLGEIPTDSDGKAVAKDIISYIQLKTDGIATDENLTLLSNRVTELEKIDHTHDNQDELDKINEGDVAKWNAATDKINNLEIPTGSTVYQGTSLDNITTDNNITKEDLNNGDFAIIKSVINGDKVSRTAYVWDSSIEVKVTDESGAVTTSYGDWVAFDGNYSAANVYIPEAIELAGNYGTYNNNTVKITKIGNKSIGDTFAAGTSLQDILKGILSQTLQPTKSDPSISISVSGSDGSIEAGTTYTKPTATLTVNSGSYTYGYKDANGNKQSGTGVTFPTAKIAFGTDDTTTATDKYETSTNLSNGGTVSIAATKYSNGTETAIYTDDIATYSFSGNASHTAGEKAIDNLGGVSVPLIQIAEKTKITATDVTASFRGYRKMFCGCTSATLDSATIRSLSLKSVKAAKGTFEVTAPEGATQIVLALPTKSVGKKYTMTKAEMYTSNWEDYTSLFSGASAISVADSRGNNGYQNYNVYTYSFAKLKADTRFQFTIAEANA